MRIFERLRRRDRSEGIERKLVETIAFDLLRQIDEEIPITVVRESGCRSCCSASDKARQ